MKELEETPEFQAKQMMVTEQFNQSVAKIQKVDLIGRLSELIEDSAEMLEDAKMSVRTCFTSKLVHTIILVSQE